MAKVVGNFLGRLLSALKQFAIRGKGVENITRRYCL